MHFPIEPLTVELVVSFFAFERLPSVRSRSVADPIVPQSLVAVAVGKMLYA